VVELSRLSCLSGVVELSVARGCSVKLANRPPAHTGRLPRILLALCFRDFGTLWPSLVGFFGYFLGAFFGYFLGAFFGYFLGAFLTTFWSVLRSSLLRRHLAGFATIYSPFLEFWVGFFWLLFCGLFLTTFWSVLRSSLLRRHLAGFATIYGPFFGGFYVGGGTFHRTLVLVT